MNGIPGSVVSVQCWPMRYTGVLTCRGCQHSSRQDCQLRTLALFWEWKSGTRTHAVGGQATRYNKRSPQFKCALRWLPESNLIVMHLSVSLCCDATCKWQNGCWQHCEINMPREHATGVTIWSKRLTNLIAWTWDPNMWRTSPTWVCSTLLRCH